MENDQITLINEDGSEELATILFTHEKNGKKYVVFEFVESGDISGAIYEEQIDGEGAIKDIETEEEWQLLDELLEEYFDGLEDEEELED
jgi:uncharacterized protein YrzB (UPF0473 family)